METYKGMVGIVAGERNKEWLQRALSNRSVRCMDAGGALLKPALSDLQRIAALTVVVDDDLLQDEQGAEALCEWAKNHGAPRQRIIVFCNSSREADDPYLFRLVSDCDVTDIFLAELAGDPAAELDALIDEPMSPMEYERWKTHDSSIWDTEKTGLLGGLFGGGKKKDKKKDKPKKEKKEKAKKGKKALPKKGEGGLPEGNLPGNDLPDSQALPDSGLPDSKGLSDSGLPGMSGNGSGLPGVDLPDSNGHDADLPGSQPLPAADLPGQDGEDTEEEAPAKPKKAKKKGGLFGFGKKDVEPEEAFDEEEDAEEEGLASNGLPMPDDGSEVAEAGSLYGDFDDLEDEEEEAFSDETKAEGGYGSGAMGGAAVEAAYQAQAGKALEEEAVGAMCGAQPTGFEGVVDVEPTGSEGVVDGEPAGVSAAVNAQPAGIAGSYAGMEPAGGMGLVKTAEDAAGAQATAVMPTVGGNAAANGFGPTGTMVMPKVDLGGSGAMPAVGTQATGAIPNVGLQGSGAFATVGAQGSGAMPAVGATGYALSPSESGRMAALGAVAEAAQHAASNDQPTAMDLTDAGVVAGLWDYTMEIMEEIDPAQAKHFAKAEARPAGAGNGIVITFPATDKFSFAKATIKGGTAAVTLEESLRVAAEGMVAHRVVLGVVEEPEDELEEAAVPGGNVPTGSETVVDAQPAGAEGVVGEEPAGNGNVVEDKPAGAENVVDSEPTGLNEVDDSEPTGDSAVDESETVEASGAMGGVAVQAACEAQTGKALEEEATNLVGGAPVEADSEATGLGAVEATDGLTGDPLRVRIADEGGLQGTGAVPTGDKAPVDAQPAGNEGAAENEPAGNEGVVDGQPTGAESIADGEEPAEPAGEDDGASAEAPATEEDSAATEAVKEKEAGEHTDNAASKEEEPMAAQTKTEETKETEAQGGAAAGAPAEGGPRKKRSRNKKRNANRNANMPEHNSKGTFEISFAEEVDEAPVPLPAPPAAPVAAAPTAAALDLADMIARGSQTLTLPTGGGVVSIASIRPGIGCTHTAVACGVSAAELGLAACVALRTRASLNSMARGLADATVINGGHGIRWRGCDFYAWDEQRAYANDYEVCFADCGVLDVHDTGKNSPANLFMNHSKVKCLLTSGAPWDLRLVLDLIQVIDRRELSTWTIGLHSMDLDTERMISAIMGQAAFTDSWRTWRQPFSPSIFVSEGNMPVRGISSFVELMLPALPSSLRSRVEADAEAAEEKGRKQAKKAKKLHAKGKEATEEHEEGKEPKEAKEHKDRKATEGKED